MNVIICSDYEQMSLEACRIVAGVMRKDKPVIGFATGSSPIGLYKKLIGEYENKKLDFSCLTTFNLDEYVGLDKNHIQSYNNFMMTNLFNHVNIDKSKVHIPSGTGDLEAFCRLYENEIEKSGGIDLQILGIGRNGHIGFNEPGVPFGSKTHIVNLDADTIEANSRFFDSIEEVPTKAVTMGIRTIMNSKSIVLIANGAQKAKAIYNTIYGPVTTECPSSVLQLHPDLTLILDDQAASMLPQKK